MQSVIFHSDDYGMTVPSSRYILDCCDNGVLNSVSVIPNSPHIGPCSQLLLPYIQSGRIKIGMHLNLVEGKALLPHGAIPLLTSEDGYFCNSFEKLFFLSLTPRKHQLRREIKLELQQQISRIQKYYPGVPLALDSHQHFHMIPLVFDTVMEIIRENNIPVRYVRLSSEPLFPFLITPSIYRYIRPINIVKNVLLNIFNIWDKKQLMSTGIPTNLFWGLMFSGDMNLTVVSKLLPRFQRIARRKGMPLEVLSHPCPIKELADCLDSRKKTFISFYISPGRYREAEMLKNIQK